MAINRYSNLTWGSYNPLTMDEMSLVPTMLRKQHDDTLAKQELIRSGLAKVDPLDVHFDEAVRLKKDLEAQMDATATELAQKGFSPDMQAKAIALNRQYNDLVSPTGRIGQINAAKQIYNEKKKNFLEQATKQYGSDRAIQLWNERTTGPKGYTGYDDKNRIKNIDDYGIVAAQDYQKDLQVFHSLLGSTSQEVAKGGGNVYYDPQLGGFKTTSSSVSQATKDNINQLNEMAKSLSNKWLNPTGEGFKFNQEAGVDLNNFANRFTADILMQREKGVSNKQDFNISFNEANKSGKDDKNETFNIDGTDLEAVSVADNKNLLDDLEGSSGDYMKSAVRKGAAAGKTGEGADKYRIKPIEKIIENKNYISIFNGLKRSGIIDKNSKLNDKTSINAVKKYLADNKDVTIMNQFVSPDQDELGALFENKQVTKDRKGRSQNILGKIMLGATQVRDSQGNVIDKDDIKNYTYEGMMTPKSQLKIFGNPDQNIMANVGWITTNDGKRIKVYTNRDSEDFNSPEYQAGKLINNISKITDFRPNIYHTIESKTFTNNGMNNVQIKYNKGNKTYNISWNENGVDQDAELTNNDFQKYMYLLKQNELNE